MRGEQGGKDAPTARINEWRPTTIDRADQQCPVELVLH